MTIDNATAFSRGTFKAASKETKLTSLRLTPTPKLTGTFVAINITALTAPNWDKVRFIPTLSANNIYPR